MKTISIKILFAIILLATGISAHAENVITMVTSKSVGDTIYLNITVNGSYLVRGAYPSGFIGTSGYKLTSDTVTITGDVTELNCYLNGLDFSDSLTTLDVSHNTALKVLNCNNNRLTALDVSKNTSLTSLTCDGNKLTALDVSHNTALKLLNCNNNRLTALEVSKNTSLTSLTCDGNKLTALDVSHNTALNSLDCSNNSLTALDVSKNTALKTLYCYGNSIGYAQMDTLVTSLADRNGKDAGEFKVINTDGDNNQISNVQAAAAVVKHWNVLSSDGKNLFKGITMVTSKSVGDTIYLNITANGSYTVSGANNVRANYYKLTSGIVTITGDVTELDCASDSLTSLDVSMDTALVSLYCSENHLTSLDLSKNTKLALLYCDNNYISFSQMDKVVKALPDRKGKTYGQSEVINTAGDHNGISKDQVAIATAKNWDVNTSDNKPYAGVNAITMVTSREVGVKINLGITANGSYTVSGANSAGGNSYTLTSQTVTITGDVTKLDCSWNGLSSLDLSHNTALDTLDCSNNDLTALDVSHNTALTMLECSKNRLTALDVSKNTALIKLYCNNNRLTALDVSHNAALTWLYCSSNNLTALEVSNNAALTALFCLNNRLTALDVSNNAVLRTLDCSSNSLTALYVSQYATLSGLYCYNNSIGYAQMDKLVTSLVDRTGKDAGTFNVINTAGDNNEISKEQVAIAKAKNWNVWSSDGKDFSGINDDYEITMVTAKSVGDTIMLGLTGSNLYLIDGATYINGNNYRLTSDTVIITGDVTALDCHGDSLTSLDLHYSAKLTSLNCSNNKLATLNLSYDPTLTSLDCSNNSLTKLDVSTDAPLINLDCSNNSLQSLDVSNNTKLITFNCSSNSLQSLDVSKNTKLVTFNCSSNSLQSLDVSHNIALDSLNCSSNSLTALSVSNDTALSKLACYGNSIGYVMMDTLVNSLADRTKEIVGEFRVLNSAGDGNKITEAQVRAARAKNWNVLTADGKDYQGIKGIELTTRKAAGEYLQCVIKPSGASFVTVGATTSATSVDSIFSCKLNSHNVTFIGNITRFECNDGALSRLTVNPAYNMDAVSCTNNYLRGSAMDALIASLTDRSSSPSGGGPAVVCQRGRLIALQADVMLPGNASVENNIITKKQVAAAGEKGWDVYIRNSRPGIRLNQV
jgi:Leucine-rich repeat (LRR) protein